MDIELVKPSKKEALLYPNIPAETPGGDLEEFVVTPTDAVKDVPEQLETECSERCP